MNDGTLPGCIGYFGKPVKPNKCEACPYVQLCKSVVAKDRLKAILADIAETKQILKGESSWEK